MPDPRTRFMSSSTNTPLGWISRTNVPASSALDSDICAVPSRYINLPPSIASFLHIDTVGSQIAFDFATFNISKLVVVVVEEAEAAAFAGKQYPAAVAAAATVVVVVASIF